MTPELGRRLRELRIAAGLTQNQLAARMGRGGRKAGTLCVRLESGDTAHPTLGLIADYLRACRASFTGILDLLNEYTRRPPADEVAGLNLVRRLAANLPAKTSKRIVYYDAKTAVARRFDGDAALPAKERLRRAQKLAAGDAQYRRAEALLRGLWPRLEAPATLMNRQAASNYAHQLWALLSKTRRLSPSARARRVAGLLIDTIEAGDLPETDVRLVHAEVRELHRRWEMTGKLDALPQPAPRKWRGPRMTERMRLPKAARDNESAVAIAGLEVGRILEAEKADLKTWLRWKAWLGNFTELGLHSAAGAPEREAKLAELVPTAPDPARAREFATLYHATLDKFKAKA
jgi:transcriptional regulator with XRE-family HTH domain